MKINVPLRRKDTEIETNQCVVEKIVELPANWFDHFSQNLLNDYDFILENADCMYQEQNGINHCLLVLGEGRDDGILIESEGSSYARYSAFVPNARQILQQKQQYDVFVKDDPDSPEWIFYDSLSDPVSLKEADMIRVLDRMVSEHGLSYTESCFDRLDGKAVRKEKPPL